jgi:hypothetical protein
METTKTKIGIDTLKKIADMVLSALNDGQDVFEDGKVGLGEILGVLPSIIKDIRDTVKGIPNAKLEIADLDVEEIALLVEHVKNRLDLKNKDAEKIALKILVFAQYVYVQTTEIIEAIKLSKTLPLLS